MENDGLLKTGAVAEMLDDHQDGRTVEYLREWDSTLAAGLEETHDTVLSTSPRVCELRQNSPFPGVLNQTERMQALRRYRETRNPAA
jgi:hypothetical protein